MGTEIHLELGGIQLSWAKNHRGTDHGALFQEGDRRALPSAQIDYDYFQEQNEDPIQMEMAFVRKLKLIVPRLELLGYTLEQARTAYNNWAMQWKDEREAVADPEDLPIPEPLSFEEFCAFANRQPVTELDDTFFHDDASWTNRTKPKGRFVYDEATISRIPRSFFHDDLIVVRTQLFRQLHQHPPSLSDAARSRQQRRQP